jgi:hypothetical protein
MRKINAIIGVLAIYALIMGLWVLIRQPFLYQTNQNVFMLMFFIGMIMTYLFIQLEKSK